MLSRASSRTRCVNADVPVSDRKLAIAILAALNGSDREIDLIPIEEADEDVQIG